MSKNPIRQNEKPFPRYILCGAARGSSCDFLLLGLWETRGKPSAILKYGPSPGIVVAYPGLCVLIVTVVCVLLLPCASAGAARCTRAPLRLPQPNP